MKYKLRKSDVEALYGLVQYRERELEHAVMKTPEGEMVPHDLDKELTMIEGLSMVLYSLLFNCITAIASKRVVSIENLGDEDE